MKPWMKWVLGIIGCLVILIILALVLVTSFINPNDYKGRIETAIHDKTGLYLNIGGDIKWTLFPSIGLSVSSINVKDQQKQPLATFQQAQLSLKLLPLIFKKVEMNKVVVNGVELNIIKMANGRFNWQQPPAAATQAPSVKPMQKASAKVSDKTTRSPLPESTKKGSSLSLNVQKIELKKINLHYQDKMSHQDLYVHNAYVTAGNILSGHTFPVSAGFTVKSKNPTLDMSFILNGNGLIDLKKQTYALNDLNLKITPLQSAAKGDSFTLKGHASMVGSAIKFNFDGSQLNLQNYLPVTSTAKKSTVSTTPSKQQSTATSNNEAKSPTGVSHEESGNKVIIPVGPIQSLNLNGKLKLTELSFNNITFDHPEIAIKADKGIAQISRLNAGFYGGTINAKTTVNAQHSTPNVSINASIAGTDLQKLGQSLKKISNIQGNVNAQVRLLAQGATQSALTRSLNGKVSFHIDKGQVTGVNVNHLVCRMVSNIRNKKIEKKDWANATQFTSLKGEWDIHNGIARNSDLTASLNQMSLKGDGWVNLVQQTMDYHLGLTITGNSAEPDESACEINPRYADITWPVQCKGQLGQKGLCGIDTERLGDTTKVILQQEAKDQLQKQLKKHLGDGIGNKLKGLFN